MTDSGPGSLFVSSGGRDIRAATAHIATARRRAMAFSCAVHDAAAQALCADFEVASGKASVRHN